MKCKNGKINRIILKSVMALCLSFLMNACQGSVGGSLSQDMLSPSGLEQNPEWSESDADLETIVPESIPAPIAKADPESDGGNTTQGEGRYLMRGVDASSIKFSEAEETDNSDNIGEISGALLDEEGVVAVYVDGEYETSREVVEQEFTLEINADHLDHSIELVAFPADIDPLTIPEAGSYPVTLRPYYDRHLNYYGVNVQLTNTLDDMMTITSIYGASLSSSAEGYIAYEGIGPSGNQRFMNVKATGGSGDIVTEFLEHSLKSFAYLESSNLYVGIDEVNDNLVFIDADGGVVSYNPDKIEAFQGKRVLKVHPKLNWTAINIAVPHPDGGPTQTVMIVEGKGSRSWLIPLAEQKEGRIKTLSFDWLDERRMVLFKTYYNGRSVAETVTIQKSKLGKSIAIGNNQLLFSTQSAVGYPVYDRGFLGRIYFNCKGQSKKYWALCVYDLNAKGPEVLLSGKFNVSHLQIAASGSYLAFSVIATNSTGEIHSRMAIFDANDETSRFIGRGAKPTPLNFNENLIAYFSLDQDGGFQISLLNLKHRLDSFNLPVK